MRHKLKARPIIDHTFFSKLWLCWLCKEWLCLYMATNSMKCLNAGWLLTVQYLFVNDFVDVTLKCYLEMFKCPIIPLFVTLNWFSWTLTTDFLSFSALIFSLSNSTWRHIFYCNIFNRLNMEVQNSYFILMTSMYYPW